MQFFCGNPRLTGSGADQGPALSAYNNFTPSRARQPKGGLPGAQTPNPQPLNRSADGYSLNPVATKEHLAMAPHTNLAPVLIAAACVLRSAPAVLSKSRSENVG